MIRGVGTRVAGVQPADRPAPPPGAPAPGRRGPSPGGSAAAVAAAFDPSHPGMNETGMRIGASRGPLRNTPGRGTVWAGIGAWLARRLFLPGSSADAGAIDH